MVEAGTLCGQADVAKKAGLFANTTSVAEAYTNVYIKEAEGKICLNARYDFVANYSNVTTVGKELLRDISSAYAAVLVLQYDMTGMRTQEAMSTINILWASYIDGIKLLSDNKFLEFIKVA